MSLYSSGIEVAVPQRRSLIWAWQSLGSPSPEWHMILSISHALMAFTLGKMACCLSRQACLKSNSALRNFKTELGARNFCTQILLCFVYIQTLPPNDLYALITCMSRMGKGKGKGKKKRTLLSEWNLEHSMNQSTWGKISSLILFPEDTAEPRFSGMHNQCSVWNRCCSSEKKNTQK